METSAPSCWAPRRTLTSLVRTAVAEPTVESVGALRTTDPRRHGRVHRLRPDRPSDVRPLASCLLRPLIAQRSVVRLLGFGISKVLYLTSQPGQPAKCDHYSILPSPRIPIEPSPSASTLASESDIVFITTTLSPSTHHLVDRDFLSKMKKDAVLVNTSRGPVVDSDALADALEHGRIFGAGVDVVEGEPNVGKDHPLVRSKRCVVGGSLFPNLQSTAERVATVPHIGSATVQTREQMAIDAVNNLLAGLKVRCLPSHATTPSLTEARASACRTRSTCKGCARGLPWRLHRGHAYNRDAI